MPYFSDLRCCFWAICGFRISFPSVGSFPLCRVVFVKSQNAFCGNRAKAGARVKYRFHLCGVLPNNNGSATLPSNATFVAVSPFAGMVIGKFTVICKKNFSKLVFNKKPSAEKLLKRYLCVGNKKTCLQKTRFVLSKITVAQRCQATQYLLLSAVLSEWSWQITRYMRKTNFFKTCFQQKAKCGKTFEKIFVRR